MATAAVLARLRLPARTSQTDVDNFCEPIGQDESCRIVHLSTSSTSAVRQSDLLRTCPQRLIVRPAYGVPALIWLAFAKDFRTDSSMVHGWSAPGGLTMAAWRDKLECWLKPFPGSAGQKTWRGCVELSCGIDRPWWLRSADGGTPCSGHRTVIKL